MIPLEYYSLKRAASILSCDESDLIHLGAMGKLPIYALADDWLVMWHQYQTRTNEEWWELLEKHNEGILKTIPDISQPELIDSWRISQLVSIDARTLKTLEATGDAPFMLPSEFQYKENERPNSVVTIRQGVNYKWTYDQGEIDEDDDIIYLKNVRLVIMHADLVSLQATEQEKSALTIIPEPAPAVPVEGESDDTGKRDKQIESILAAAEQMEYDPLEIPEGGKKAIKDICLKDNKLFTSSGFDHAWKAANKRNVIRMENKEKYK